MTAGKLTRAVVVRVLAVFALYCTFVGQSLAVETLNFGTASGGGNLLATPMNTNVGGITVTTSATQSGGPWDSTPSIATSTGGLNGVNGVIFMTMDAALGASLPWTQVTFSFSRPVTNLAFTVIDIDGGPTHSWNDRVVYSSVPAVAPTVVTLGSQVSWTSATQTAQATSNANVSGTTGNLRLFFPQPVTQVTVRYIAGPVVDGSGDGANSQSITIDDLSWDSGVVRVRKSTSPGVGGPFSFSQTNLLSTPSNITTTAASTPAPASPAAHEISGPGTNVTVTESVPAGWALASATCSDANSAITGNAGNVGTLSGNTVTLSASSLVLSGANITCTFNNTPPPPPSFGTCDARMFLDQTASSISTLYNVGYGSTPFTYTNLGSSTTQLPRNGIGYNTVDNYIYGIRWVSGSGNELIRVGSNGSSQNLGVVSGLIASNYNNGTISPTGDYYLMSGFGGTTMYRVNLATREATAFTLSQSVQSFDFAWHDGLLWGISSGRLVSIDPTSGVVTDVGPTSPISISPAMWGFDNVLLANNTSNSSIYAIDPATGAATLLSSAPPATNADGANCPTASIIFSADLSVTKTNTPASGPNDLAGDSYVPGQARTYTVVVSNPSGGFGAQNITVSDPVPAGIDPATVSWTCVSTSGGARCGAASGTGALNDAGLDLPPGAVATYTMTMTVPATFTGNLTNTVTVTPPSYITDTNTANNTATDTDIAVQQPDFGTCDARMFMDQVPGSASTLYDVTYGTTPFTLSSLGSGAPRNAIGYNMQDNYIYGVGWTPATYGQLIRVGSDGSSTNLGAVTGLLAVNHNNGVISPAGDYYVTASFNGTPLYRINITTRVATPITLSRAITVSDLAWHNGLLYGIHSNSAQGPIGLTSINPTTGAVTFIGASSPLSSALAMWGFDNSLLASDGNDIYAVDPATGVTTLASALSPATPNGDGANCPGADIQFDADLSVTKTNTPASGPSDLANDSYVPGEVRTYTIAVRNSSSSFGAQNITVSDPVPAGISAATMSWTCAATSGGAVCGAASGTGALNDTGLDLPAGAVATYLVTMTVPAGFTGDLTNTVTITPPSTINDTNAANNTASDVDQSAPQLTIRKISIGGVDSFGFTGTNGVVAQTLTTTTVGSPVSGATQALTAAGTATTITESTTPATYQVTDITCTGLGAGGVATPDLANRTVALDAVATAAGANIECTFTNTLQQTDIQVVKTASPDPVVSGDVVTYQIVVSNNGPLAASNVLLTDVAGAGQDCTTPSTTATCSATGGASCPSPAVPVSSLLGAGITIPSLPVGGQVALTLQCSISANGL